MCLLYDKDYIDLNACYTKWRIFLCLSTVLCFCLNALSFQNKKKTHKIKKLVMVTPLLINAITQKAGVHLGRRGNWSFLIFKCVCTTCIIKRYQNFRQTFTSEHQNPKPLPFAAVTASAPLGSPKISSQSLAKALVRLVTDVTCFSWFQRCEMGLTSNLWKNIVSLTENIQPQ